MADSMSCLCQDSIQEAEPQEGCSGIGHLWTKGISAYSPSQWSSLLCGWHQWAIHGRGGTLSPPADSGLGRLLARRPKSPPKFNYFLNCEVATGLCLEVGNQKLGSRNPVPLQAVPYLNFSIPGYQKSTSASGINLQGHHTLSYQKEFQEVPSRGRQAGCSRPPDALTWHPSDLQLSSWWVIHTTTETSDHSHQRDL